MFRKCAAFLLLAVLALSFSFAARAADPPGFPARVRVESCVAGNDATLLPMTTVYLPASENTAYWALSYALAAKLGEDNDALRCETGDYGMYIMSLMGQAQDDACSWMFAVNGETPWVSFDQCVLQSGDSVVFYFIDWQAASYAYFDKPMVLSEAGAEFTLTLKTDTWDETGIPVEGAAILVDGVPSEFVTDADGAARVSLPENGTYALSASLPDENGNETISRPFCEAIVKPVPADGEAALYVSAANGAVFLNREALDAPVAPFARGGAVYVPLRAVADALGGVVGWNPETKEASVTFGGAVYTCKTSAAVNGAYPMIVRDRMMAPVGFITDIFGIEAD